MSQHSNRSTEWHTYSCNESECFACFIFRPYKDIGHRPKLRLSWGSGAFGNGLERGAGEVGCFQINHQTTLLGEMLVKFPFKERARTFKTCPILMTVLLIVVHYVILH